MQVLHVAPHIGGGVGSVLKSFFECSNSYGIENHLYCLDFCKSNFFEIDTVSSKKEGMFYVDDYEEVYEELEAFDAVLIHYWNNPLIARFLVSSKLPTHKTVFWIHNSGLFEPHIIPDYLVKIASKVLFTSVCSYAAPNLKGLIKETPDKFGVVHSTRALGDFLNIGENQKSRSARKHLLYVGTVSDAKMHPHSAKIFSQLSKDRFRVQVVGGPDHNELKARVEELGGSVEVFGEVNNVLPFFTEADIFVYPLRPEHYGTGEQVILEAMAAGLPVVAFKNPAESVILEEGGGLLVESVENFVDQVCNLSRLHDLYEMVSKVGVSRAKSDFDIKTMVFKLISELNFSNECFGKNKYRASFNKGAEFTDLEIYVLHSFFDGKALSNAISNDPDNAVFIVFNKIANDLKNSDAGARWLGLGKATPSHYRQVFSKSASLSKLDKLIISNS